MLVAFSLNAASFRSFSFLNHVLLAEDEADLENELSNELKSDDSSDSGDDFKDKKSKKKDEFSDKKDDSDSEDDFKVKKKKKDEFSDKSDDSESDDDLSSSSNLSEDSSDDFVLEKRVRTVSEYKEPDIAKVVFPSFLYQYDDLKSKKIFELYKNDELEVLETKDKWLKVSFLDKVGWVRREDVRLEEYHTAKFFGELNSGIGFGAGDLKNYSLLSQYNVALFFSFKKIFSVGGEFRTLFVNYDVAYVMGGPSVRFFVPKIQTKNSRVALTLSGGYIVARDRPGYNDTSLEYKILSGPYTNFSIDYVYRIVDYFYLGVGTDLHYEYLYGKTDNETFNKKIFSGGVHLKFLFNIIM